jgi:ABC-2 type transport system permease protein
MIMMQALSLIVAGSIAFNGMMFLLMVRVDDPLVPRAMFGVLNVLLLYPSGAMYPTSSFPKWMQAIGVVDPFTYVIHGFKEVLLKDGGWVSIWHDLLFLVVFGITTLLVATPLFKRTL